MTLLLTWFPDQAFIYDSNFMNAVMTASQPRPCFVSCANLILHVLNNIARFDLSWFQSSLGSSVNQVPFLHVVACVLSKNVIHAISRENQYPSIDELVMKLLTLVGLYALKHVKNQETLRWGHVNVIQRLTGLPFRYFSEPRYSAHTRSLSSSIIRNSPYTIDSRGSSFMSEYYRYKDALFPTLIAICYGDEENTAILEQDVSRIMLSVYLRKQLRLQKAYYCDGIQKRTHVTICSHDIIYV